MNRRRVILVVLLMLALAVAVPDAIGHFEVDALSWSNVAPLWRAVDSLLALRD